MSWEVSLLHTTQCPAWLAQPKKVPPKLRPHSSSGSWLCGRQHWAELLWPWLPAGSSWHSVFLSPWGTVIPKFSPPKAGWRGHCPNRQCTAPGWCRCWGTSVKKLHIYKFSGPNACVWCLVQPSLCSQKGMFWTQFWKSSRGGLCCDVYSHPAQPRAAWRQWRPHSQGRCSSPCWAGDIAWGWGEGCRPQRCSPGRTQDAAAECTITPTDVLWGAEYGPSQLSPQSFYGARPDVSVPVLLKTGVSKSLWISGLFGL